MIGVGIVLRVSSGSPCPKDMGHPPLSLSLNLKRARPKAAAQVFAESRTNIYDSLSRLGLGSIIPWRAGRQIHLYESVSRRRSFSDRLGLRPFERT